MGLTVFDAGVLIGFLDASDAHHAATRQALTDARDRGDRIVMPASALAEALVGPARRGASAIAAVQNLVARLPIEIAPLDETVAVAAAQLRARHAALKLPDALVIATASTLGADTLVTTDRRWPSRTRLGLTGRIVHV
jgi:predicted nucleic acid-binding protein